MRNFQFKLKNDENVGFNQKKIKNRKKIEKYKKNKNKNI